MASELAARLAGRPRSYSQRAARGAVATAAGDPEARFRVTLRAPVDRSGTVNERADALDDDRLLAHAAWLRTLAQSLARGADAEDLAQETWRIALERRPASVDDGRLRGWLATVARRLALR
ncbi:MAG: hypothetical protein EPO68_12770, partial [Planctomycetota bacterium]